MTSILPGVEINLFFLVSLGLATGIISGFVGVGGGVILTPALIISGIPANFAVGTSLLWITGNAIVGAMRHRQEGNIDFKLALVTTIFMTAGIELGVKLLQFVQLHGVADSAVLSISCLLLFTVGSYMLWESTRLKSPAGTPDTVNEKRISFGDMLRVINIPPKIAFRKSGIRISLFLLAGISLAIGILSGSIGVGGGFIMVPALIYLFGVPSYTAVGTSLFQIIFSSGFGSLRHIMSGNVLIYVSLLILLGSSIGTQIGAIATRYLESKCMRFVLATTILVAVTGSVLKLVEIKVESTLTWLSLATSGVIFGGLVFIALLITGLLVVRVFLHRRRNSSEFLRYLFKE